MTDFNHGPFSFSAAPKGAWTMRYGAQELAVKRLPASLSQSEVIEEFSSYRAAFIREAMQEYAPSRLDLIDFETSEAVAYLFSYDMCGMTPGLIDDRSRYWLRSADRLYSRNVTLTEFAQIAVKHAAPDRGWIAGLLPADVLTQDMHDWRAPTSMEIRHIVGEGSFTGISGAKAAELVGVTPQNFRKYTARDDAASRQNMSFSMWHLLLEKMGVL